MRVFRFPPKSVIDSEHKLVEGECEERDLGRDEMANYIATSDDSIELCDSSISFRGSGSIIYFGPKTRLKQSSIAVHGSNDVAVFEGGGKGWPLLLQLSMGFDSLFVMGGNHFISPYGPRLKVIQGERRNVFVGRTSLISNSVIIRTSDAHALYDLEQERRVNEAHDVVIGDRVWLGEDSMVLKGSVMESGSVLGAKAVLVNKRVPANSVAAGNPAHIVREGVFWERPGVNFKDAATLESRLVPKTTTGVDYRQQPLPVWIEELRGIEQEMCALEKLRATLSALDA